MRAPSWRGQWIYHVPGTPCHRTRPEEIFCTEAEARAGGYRRAMVRYKDAASVRGAGRPVQHDRCHKRETNEAVFSPLHDRRH